MSTSHKISLQSAVLMNLNIMAGAGVFVNILDLTSSLGIFGGLLYLAVGLFMFPLVFTFARLVQAYPSGGFYAFAKPISPFLGFLSAWTYFFGKLASATFLIHVSATFLQKLVPAFFGCLNLLMLDFLMLFLFLCLNFLNLRIGILIQRSFFVSKSVPLIMFIALGVYYFDINVLQDLQFVDFSNFIVMLPLVLYCFSGFEAACSISRNIENAEKNAPKAIFYSFFCIIAVYVAFQTLVGMMLASQVGVLAGYADAFFYLSSLIPVASLIQAKIATMISFMIGFSAMGAAYGLLFSNAWNLYSLAEHGHTFAQHKLSLLNKHAVPIYAVMAEGLICALFLLVTGGAKIPLQQTASLGCTLTYTISSIAFLILFSTSNIIGLLSLLTCSGFIAACIFSAKTYNFTSIYLFMAMLLFGFLMYFLCSKNKN